MYAKHKIVTITPVGRKKYLQVLVPYLLKNKGLVDEHYFWINTNNAYDLAYIHSVCCQYPNFFKIINAEKITVDNENSNISNLYHNFTDSKTIYIKINDDICWMNNNTIEELVKFRLKHQDFFLIYPLTINTGRTANLHQIMGHLPVYLTGEWPGTYHWKFDLREHKAKIGEEIHNTFLRHIDSGEINKLFIGKYIITNYENIPEHCICWFGKDFINQKTINEYNWLTEQIPKNNKQYSCICGNSLVSHFAYKNQESYLLQNTKILEKYTNISTTL